MSTLYNYNNTYKQQRTMSLLLIDLLCFYSVSVSKFLATFVLVRQFMPYVLRGDLYSTYSIFCIFVYCARPLTVRLHVARVQYLTLTTPFTERGDKPIYIELYFVSLCIVQSPCQTVYAKVQYYCIDKGGVQK